MGQDKLMMHVWVPLNVIWSRWRHFTTTATWLFLSWFHLIIPERFELILHKEVKHWRVLVVVFNIEQIVRRRRRRPRPRKRHLKRNLFCLKLYRAYSISFNSLNVGKYFCSWILKDCIKVQEKKRQVVVLCSRPRQNVKLGTFTL